MQVVAKDCFRLIGCDVMLPQQLVNNVPQPNEPRYPHFAASKSASENFTSEYSRSFF
jgi:hypothetical protein